MKYTIKFYPEKRKGIIQNVPVMMSVTFSGNRLFYYTGKRCNLNQWDLGSDPENNPDYSLNRLKRNQITSSGETSTAFNSDLNKIKLAVDELFKAYEVNNTVPKIEQLRDDLKTKLGREVKKVEATGFFDRYDQYIKEGLFSPNRKKKLQTTLNKLKKWRPNTQFNTLDVQYLTDFQNHLLNDCDLSRNAAISEIKCLRSFLNYAVKHGWATNYPFDSFSIDAETYGDPVFITIDERDKLFGAYIPNASLSRVRDMFVFQCLIGCRVGDLIKLKKSNIVNGCIEYIAGKTKDHKSRIARVPLTEKAKAILSKYDLPNGDLLPYISDVKYNKYIKDLFRCVEINRIVTTVDPKTRENIQKPICEIASSHMARRVFVGGLYSKGVKNEIIGSMSGHVEGSKAFSRYYNIDIKDQQSAINLID